MRTKHLENQDEKGTERNSIRKPLRSVIKVGLNYTLGRQYNKKIETKMAEDDVK